MTYKYTTMFRVGNTAETVLVCHQRPLSDKTIAGVEYELAFSFRTNDVHTAESQTYPEGTEVRPQAPEFEKLERTKSFNKGLAAGFAIGLAFFFAVVAIAATAGVWAK